MKLKNIRNNTTIDLTNYWLSIVVVVVRFSWVAGIPVVVVVVLMTSSVVCCGGDDAQAEMVATSTSKHKYGRKTIFFFITANPLHKIVGTALNEAMKEKETVIDHLEKRVLLSIIRIPIIVPD